ncbi:hypothetical protein ACFXPV_19215 [Streptomyces sp. NPDC059118]|uniref:hypothetical protein n=1 Tax=unclassified Streptomyces TaxID=2593676 RepID=UPI00367A91B8
MTPVDGAAGIGVGPVAGADTGRGETGRPGAVPRDPVGESLLTLLGLAPDEDAVYRLLLDRPDSEPDTPSGPLSGRAVTRVLDSLVERGLASAARPDGDGTVRYRAASPVLALGPLLESRRSALHRVESLVGDLTERHRAARTHASGAPVEVLTGPAAIRRRLLTMQRQARREVCTLVPTRHVPAVLSFADNHHEEVDAEMIQRGVTVRSVAERAWLERPETAAVPASCVAQGQHISVTDRLPIKLAMADRRIALLPLDPERETEPVGVAPAMTQGLDESARLGTPAEAARAHIKAHEDTYKVPVSDLRTVRTTRDGKQSSVGFQQKHDGVPVFGAEYAVQTRAADGGQQVTSATGTLYTDLTVSTTPKVSEATAERRMFTLDRGLPGVRGARTEAHGLSVLHDARGGRLAWHFTVTGGKANGTPVRQEVYVDARVGGIALSYNNIDAADASPAQGTGVRVDGTEAELHVNKEADGSYTLVDSTRAMYPRTGGQIRTYDANRREYTAVAGGPVTDDIRT